MHAPILPGQTIGIMGSGQLGRMLALCARRMGYRVHVFSPKSATPAGELANLEVAAEYDDADAVDRFARGVNVLTFEFENIPSATVARCEALTLVRPAGRVLHIAQERLREKEFLREAGLPLPEFREVNQATELESALAELGTPAVLKAASFGYDGKGQRRLEAGDDLAGVWKHFAGSRAVLEAFVPFRMELSVVVARGADGEVETYPVCENIHRHHILDFTVAPARIDAATAEKARALARDTARAFDLVGLIGVEMFLLGDGRLLINEIAPRPHNSGHFTFGACVTSQFEQQLRAVCGLPLGDTSLLRPAVMANLLGDLWEKGEPDWAAALRDPSVKLHLYDKAEPRPGRKMGHLVVLADDVETALTAARRARERLVGGR